VASPSNDVGLAFVKKWVMKLVARRAIRELEVALGGFALRRSGEVRPEAVIANRYLSLFIPVAYALVSFLGGLLLLALGQFVITVAESTAFIYTVFFCHQHVVYVSFRV